LLAILPGVSNAVSQAVSNAVSQFEKVRDQKAIDSPVSGIDRTVPNGRPLALIKTLTLNPSPKSGEGLDHPPRDRRNPAVLAPLRPPWEKGLGDEGNELIRARGLVSNAGNCSEIVPQTTVNQTVVMGR